MLLKACLKAQGSNPKALNASLGQKKARLMKLALDMFFWSFLKKHKACLGTLLNFIAKKILIIKINCLILKEMTRTNDLLHNHYPYSAVLAKAWAQLSAKAY